jgi:hypothetical protein
VYRSQLRSTYLCTDSTSILPASVSVVAMNYDHFGSLAPPHYSQLSSCSVLVPHTRTVSVLSRLGWLNIFLIYSRVSYCYYKHKPSRLCRTRYRVFPVIHLYCAYCKVGSEPPCTYMLYCVPYSVLFTCVLKIAE